MQRQLLREWKTQTNYQIASLSELEIWVGDWLLQCQSKHQTKHIIALSGEMGVGKTQFTRLLVKKMGGADVSSPSFALHNIYQTTAGQVDHIDLYRLKNSDDLESIGFWDFFTRAQGCIVIEWADRLELEVLPFDWQLTAINMSFTGENPLARELTVREF